MRIKFIFLFLIFIIQISFTQDFESSNLPIIIIDTEGQEIPDEPKIGASMAIIDNGPDKRNLISDPPNNYDGLIGIEKEDLLRNSFLKIPTLWKPAIRMNLVLTSHYLVCLLRMIGFYTLPIVIKV